MSPNTLPKTAWDQSKESAEVDYDVDTAPAAERNIETSSETNTERQSDTCDESYEMEWDDLPSTPPAFKSPESNSGYSRETKSYDLPVTPPAYTSPQSTTGFKSGVLRSADIRNITAFFANTKLISGRAEVKPRGLNFSHGNTQEVFMEPASKTITKTYTGLSVSGPSQSKDVNQNPLIKAKTRKTPPQSKVFVPNRFELPLTKRKIAETFTLTEACNFFLNFMKSKRADLKYMEGQLDSCTTELQKAMKDAEQVGFKLEAVPEETVAKDMNDAITKSQKLNYLLSISSRSFEKLDKIGSQLHESLQEYTKEILDYHTSIDTLLEYIIEAIVEKCKKFGTG